MRQDISYKKFDPMQSDNAKSKQIIKLNPTKRKKCVAWCNRIEVAEKKRDLLERIS